jgi:3-dehydroquinate synthetase
MRHDKKSENGEINLTLLRAPGDVVINQIASADEAKSALDIFRDLMHE